MCLESNLKSVKCWSFFFSLKDTFSLFVRKNPLLIDSANIQHRLQFYACYEQQGLPAKPVYSCGC